MGDFVTLQRGTTYSGQLVGQAGPALLGLGSIEPGGGFRADKYQTFGGDCPPKIMLAPGDIYVALKGATKDGSMVGSVARLPNHIPAGRLTQDTVRLDFIKRSSKLANYLYWVLRTPHYRDYCAGRVTGSAAAALSREDFLAYPVPPITSTTEALVDLFEAIEAKIDLNRSMNETLEAIARAMFRSWFVDFDPVRAKAGGRDPCLPTHLVELFPDAFEEKASCDLPKGWEVADLRSLTSYLNRGIGPTYVEAGGICVLNQKCVRNRRVDFSKSRRHDPTKRPVGGRQLCVLDVLVNSTGVGTLGRVGQLWEVPEDVIVDSHVTVVRAADGVDPWFLGIMLMEREPEIEALGEGSTGQTELSRARFGGLRCLVPSTALQRTFGRQVAPLLKRLIANEKQSRTLAALRDALLPKLISGALRVADAERAVGGRA